MSTIKNSMIDFLRHAFIEPKSDVDTKAPAYIDPDVVVAFYNGEKTDLDYKQQWLLHKYAHSASVLEAGIDIILNEEKLNSQPENIKQAWYDALLMHDVGRAYEVNNQGKRILRYPHGTLGMEMLHRMGVESPHTLLPVLMHDRINFDIFALKPEEIKTDAHFSNVPDNVKETIKSLMEQYHKMDSKEQETIRLGCQMVIDADQMANLNEFHKMLNLSRCEKRPEISEAVEQAVKEGRYVDYKDLKTYPDEAVAYMAWVYGGNFPSFKKDFVKNKLLDKMRHFVIRKMMQNDPTKDFKDLDDKLKKIQKTIEKNIKAKKIACIRESKKAALKKRKQKQRVVARMMTSRKVK